MTSNKELVASKGQELLSKAKEKNVNYLYEASVGGGIPIIRPIPQCLAANLIDEIYGILNGTTNYILTEMIRKGTSFDDALNDAQSKGFAEQNPAADVEGTDACRKICILSDLCFGYHVDPNDVSTEGISGVTLSDVEFAHRKGYKIKLLGRACAHRRQIRDRVRCASSGQHGYPAFKRGRRHERHSRPRERHRRSHVLRCRRRKAAHGQRRRPPT